jgi:phosphate transport system substrate-binding protein
MGLCRLSCAYDPLTRNEIEGIKVIPIDCNANGILDEKENFYEDLDELQRAIWLGKYPCHAYIDHYMLIKGDPAGRWQTDFMKFVLSDGQKTIQKEGFISPTARIIQGEMHKLNELQASL